MGLLSAELPELVHACGTADAEGVFLLIDFAVRVNSPATYLSCNLGEIT